MTSELRTDLLTGRQVIVAPGRSERPGAESGEPPLANGSPDHDPFLEGNEEHTPQESLALRHTDSAANQPGWLLRVVPNRYPAVSRTADGRLSPEPEAAGSELTRQPVTGAHEVVVECPDPRQGLTELTTAEIARILFAWRSRIASLSGLPQIEYLSVFRNQGFSAGASLPHSHSQIVGLNHVPPAVQERVRRSATFAVEKSAAAGKQSGPAVTDLVQHLLNQELQAETRIVLCHDDFTILCPFASRVARHVRWLPTRANAFRFQDLADSDLMQLAASLLDVAQGLETVAGPAALNLVLSLPPKQNANAFRWMLELLPRTARVAGFEMITDVDILTTAPETTARQLRDAVQWQPPSETAVALTPAGYEWRAAQRA